MEAKRRIHKFNFDKDKMMSGAPVHVALVDSAANLTEVLVMKCKTQEENIMVDAIKDVEDTKEEAVVEVTKSAEEMDALKAQQEEILKMKEVIEELRKSQVELEVMKAEREKAKIEQTTEVVKGFNLFEDEQIEEVVKFFVANDKSPAVAHIITSLEKARECVKSFGEAEHGTELKNEDASKSKVEVLSNSVSEILKSRREARLNRK